MLIHAAAGGIGTFAVQLAKWRGSRVLGTASENNLAFLRDLGVDEPIDYNAVRFEEVAQDVDVVLDTVGGQTQARSWAVLWPGGVLVSMVEPPSAETAAAHGVRQAFLGTKPDAAQLSQISQLVSGGDVQPHVSTVLPLDEARQAHTLSESRHLRRQDRASGERVEALEVGRPSDLIPLRGLGVRWRYFLGPESAAAARD